MLVHLEDIKRAQHTSCTSKMGNNITPKEKIQEEQEHNNVQKGSCKSQTVLVFFFVKTNYMHITCMNTITHMHA